MKLLCINDDFSKVLPELLREAKGKALQLPVKNETYTIRKVFENDGLVTSYLLHELHNPVYIIPAINVIRELSFASWRFAEVNDSESIEEFIEDITHAY